jgi:predicted amidohydrolase
MSKRDLYKKYVETFGVRPTLIQVITKLGELGICICMDLLKDEKPLALPIHYNEDLQLNLSAVQIAVEVLLQMMNEGGTQLFLTQKHYQLNQMEMDIRNKENETVSQ